MSCSCFVSMWQSWVIGFATVASLAVRRIILVLFVPARSRRLVVNRQSRWLWSDIRRHVQNLPLSFRFCLNLLFLVHMWAARRTRSRKRSKGRYGLMIWHFLIMSSVVWNIEIETQYWIQGDDGVTNWKLDVWIEEVRLIVCRQLWNEFQANLKWMCCTTCLRLW